MRGGYPTRTWGGYEGMNPYRKGGSYPPVGMGPFHPIHNTLDRVCPCSKPETTL